MDINPDSPIINIETFRRDVYLLTALLLADEQIGNIANIKNAANDYYESEVNRLLVLISVSARQFIDRDENIDQKIDTECDNCGKYWQDPDKRKDAKRLIFRQACNSIIHAEEIIAYDMVNDSTDSSPKKGFYAGTITIRGKRNNYKCGKRYTSKTRAELDGVEFAKYCIVLTDLLTTGS